MSDELFDIYQGYRFRCELRCRLKTEVLGTSVRENYEVLGGSSKSYETTYETTFSVQDVELDAPPLFERSAITTECASCGEKVQLVFRSAKPSWANLLLIPGLFPGTLLCAPIVAALFDPSPLLWALGGVCLCVFLVILVILVREMVAERSVRALPRSAFDQREVVVVDHTPRHSLQNRQSSGLALCKTSAES